MIKIKNDWVHRSHSPNSPRSRNVKSHQEETLKPVHDLDYHVRQVKHALTHFKDVISKNKLEMLPGNGTVVLESIANVHTGEFWLFFFINLQRFLNIFLQHFKHSH